MKKVTVKRSKKRPPRCRCEVIEFSVDLSPEEATDLVDWLSDAMGVFDPSQCRRNPPQLVSGGGGELIRDTYRENVWRGGGLSSASAWPAVQRTDFCGEFQPRPTPAP